MYYKRIGVILLTAMRVCAATPPVVISEFMADNNGFILDSFKNSSDWVELQNTTSHSICLLGWSLTDDASAKSKWVFPNVTLPPWGTLLVWASNADIRDPGGELHTNFALSKNGEYLGLYDANHMLVHEYAPRFPAQYENIAYGLPVTVTQTVSELVSNTSSVRALCPATDALGTSWRSQAFDDGAWQEGSLPAGYATKNPAWLSQVSFSLQSIALGKPGVYLRSAFELADASAVQALSFDMAYDDGAAIFINGSFALSANTPALGALNYATYSSSILTDPSTLTAADISAVTNALTDGRNMLAVHLMNCNATSSDLFIKPRLTALCKTMTATNEPCFLATPTPGALNVGSAGQRLAQAVTFSEQPGIKTAAFSLTLSGALVGQTIRYTLNGAEPSPTNSTLYTGALAVSSSLHLRARVFDALGRCGDTRTAPYTFAASDSATLSFATSLPVLVLRENDPVLNGIPTSESTNYTACSAHLIEPVGGWACLTSPAALTARAGIHIRGSSSSGFAKKPYALTFWGEDNDDKKVALSGFPSGSDFALISCYCYDRSYLHDSFLFDLSRQLGRYAPRTRWVELFLIGSDSANLSAANYAGLYVLEERVKAGNDRVPIDDIVAPDDLTLPALSGSYFFKCDRVDYDEYSWLSARNYPGGSGRYLVIGYPKLDTLQTAQKNYLVSTIQSFEDTLYSSAPMNPTNGVTRQIDLLSWVDFHIFNMFSMNVDAFTLSTWFHKDRGGKIMAGPLWDFDRSLGPYGYEVQFPNAVRWDIWSFAPDYFGGAAWWAKLHAQPAFRRLYWDRWAELRQGVFSAANLVATITRLKSNLSEAATQRDYVKWNQWPNRQFGSNHAGEVEWLTWFVTNRVEWIDQNQFAKSSLLKAPLATPGSCVLAAGSALSVTLTAPEGNVLYYTVDDTDPALWNNQVYQGATACASGTAISITRSTRLFARAYNTADGRWSLATRAEYLIGGRYAQPGDLVLSEVHYNPCDVMPHEAALLPEILPRAFEFVEILNTAECDISLSGCRFPEGQPAEMLTLSGPILKPGGHAVIARHSEAFAVRYGQSVAPVACWLYGSLSDGGDSVTLLNRNGIVLDRLTYKTSGSWPKAADGGGLSINRAAYGPYDTQPWRDAIPTPGSGCYWEWAGLQGISAGEEDDDNDGVANLFEYFAGTDPLDPTDRGAADLHDVHLGSDGLALSFRQAAARPDVCATLETSEDLYEWSSVDSGCLSGTACGDGTTWTLSLPSAEMAAHPRQFFRLRLTQPKVSGSGGTLPPPL